MKKNRMMRLASVLLVLVLLTTSVISGTFAKYTTSVTSNDKARVAYWGFQSSNSMDITGLFTDTYTHVDSVNDADVIAPGTSGSASFQFKWDEEVSAYGAAVAVTGPEVKYNFTVAVEDVCDSKIENNVNILWSLDGNEYKPTIDTEGNITSSSWDQMVAAIEALSGDVSGTKEYEANTLPSAFTAVDNVHTISWRWIFSNSVVNDAADTAMGNADELDDCSIKITITATQVD